MGRPGCLAPFFFFCSSNTLNSVFLYLNFGATKQVYLAFSKISGFIEKSSNMYLNNQSVKFAKDFFIVQLPQLMYLGKLSVIQLSLMSGQKLVERHCAGWVVSISEAQAGVEEKLLLEASHSISLLLGSLEMGSQ